MNYTKHYRGDRVLIRFMAEWLNGYVLCSAYDTESHSECYQVKFMHENEELEIFFDENAVYAAPDFSELAVL